MIDTKDPSSSSSESDDEHAAKKEDSSPPPKFNTVDIENLIDNVGDRKIDDIDPAYRYSIPEVKRKK